MEWEREARRPAKRQQELTEVAELKRQGFELQTALKQQQVREEPAEGKGKKLYAELNAEQHEKLRAAVKIEHNRVQQRFQSEVTAEVERRCGGYGEARFLCERGRIRMRPSLPPSRPGAGRSEGRYRKRVHIL
jgi:seryl-tRNA synthetase